MPSIHDQVVNFEGEPYTDEKPSDIVIQEIAKDQIKINKVTIGEFFGDRFRIPEYQRGYQWDEEQWDDLWEEINDFIRAGENLDRTGERTSDVFFGSMFFSERDASEVFDSEEEGVVYDIIDGQQRMTTLTIIFKIIAEELKINLTESDDGNLIGRYAQHVGLTNNLIYKGGDAKSGPAITLEPRNRDFFRALMRDKEALYTYILYQDQVPTQSRGDGQIKIRDFLEAFDIDENEYLNRLFDTSYFANNQGDEYLSGFLQDSKYTALNGKRPNVQLYEKDKDVLNSNSSVNQLSEDERNELLDNRVEFDGTNQLLFNCYQYYKEKFDDHLESKSPEEKYRFVANIKNYLINSFRVGKFKIEDDRPELLMKIFEVLNDRGLELKKTDLIRTKLVGQLNNLPEGEKDEYIEKYNDIIRRFSSDHEQIVKFLETYFVIDQSGITSRGEVSSHLLEAFSEQPGRDKGQRLDSKLTSPEDTKTLIDDLEQYSVLYHHITEPVRTGGFHFDTESDNVRLCNQQLHRLNQTDTDIWEPLVLAFYYDIKTGHLDEIYRLNNILDVIESFVIRYYVTGDINAKDSIYEEGIKSYQNHGLSGSVVEDMISKAWETDRDIFGETLVSALASEEWSAKRARPVLQKLAAEDLEPDQEDTLLSIKLNQDTDEVELEHVFPQEPFAEEDEERYDLVENFFEIVESGAPTTVDEDTTFTESLKYLIENGEDDRLEEIVPAFSKLLGNSILLISNTNNGISNEQFSIKVVGYASTPYFDELLPNQYISENFIQEGPLEQVDVPDDLKSVDDIEDFIYSEITEPEEFIREFNSYWNWEAVWENTETLLVHLMESIQFDPSETTIPDITEEEVEEFVANEKSTLEDIVRANNRRYI